MRQNRLTLAVAAAVAVVFLLRMMVYTVRDTEVAVVLTFGRPASEQLEPGLGFKWPWPIQDVRTFDKRLRVLQAPVEELTTSDRQAVLVGSFLLWRVSSAQTFVEKVGDADEVALQLETALRTAQAEAVSQVPFGALVSADPAQLRYEEVEETMLAAVRTEADRLGVEVQLAGIRRMGLPEAATEAVFERMRKEREARAADIRAQGAAEAGRIRAEAERERDEALDQARAAARTRLGEAEQEAAEHYAVLNQDRGLAIYLKKLEALEELLSSRATVVLDKNTTPVDLLAPASNQAEGGRD